MFTVLVGIADGCLAARPSISFAWPSEREGLILGRRSSRYASHHRRIQQSTPTRPFRLPGGLVSPASMNENTENLDSEDSFEAALQRHGMEFDAPLAESLRQYAELMWRYNEQLNLTRHTTWDLFVGRDLRDCLQLAHLIQPDEVVLDLGSGNGVPGIPLAILRPDVEVSLAESVGKRAKVLDEMVTELNLAVPVYAARGEQLLEDFRFTTIVSRAVGSLLKFCRWVEPHWSSFDRLLLVKGPRWVEERGEARHHGALKDVDLRVLASYPLGPPALDGGDDETPEGDEGADDAGPGQGVVLQLSRKGRFE
ncbi:16S rRNA (guanine(527)-N(7))-methyltransferase RsmG [Allorhodopirellula heiligendammensis]|uniref:Ribosomal RNA small subunit methyltransferase G n=1 Tax=Allorhodopirellula heiligendammensis TaxID=2714739 RepID=A0A5C6BUM0_9BACT|nr:16S rRNA (guanine(527)-N(7))-methyltransferase RsmG [Allorhodopirellula heiligendammensis]TWU15725.1 Ribosomal RNA small subunit methyltransferase G [Allorhodopirellula heiligendammensis]